MAGDPTPLCACKRLRARRTVASKRSDTHERSRMSESHDNAARITAVSGVLFVALFLVAFLLFTKSGYPDSNDGARKIGAYMVEHRDAALWQQFVIGLAFLAGAG